MGALAHTLPGGVFAFALVLCRVVPAVLLIPGLGEASLPVTVRAALATVLAATIAPLVAGGLPAEPEGVGPLAAMTLGEIGCGLLLGMLARAAALSLTVAGGMIAVFVGISSILQTDPELGAQETALARLMGMLMAVLVLSGGLYALPIAALARSYDALPAGKMFDAGDAARLVMAATVALFAEALRLAAPFVLLSVVWQVSLGLIGRIVPRLQIYFVALPGQILAGVILFAMTVGGIARLWQDTLGQAWSHLPGA